MPRIRTLKPEALQHRKVGRLSDRAFRLWIGLITQADDHGRLIADTAQFRLLVFGYQDRTKLADVEGAIEEIAGTGLVRFYTVGGIRYADFPSWGDHQRVDHPRDSVLPPYQVVAEHDGIPREDSRTFANDHGGSDRIGSEGSDRRTLMSGSAPDLAPLLKQSLPSQYRQQALEVLQFLNAKTGKSFQPANGTLDPIIARLRDGATVGQCKGVIASRARKWRGDEKMAEYLRPKTLFNRTNFAQYQADLPPLEIAGGGDGS